MANDKGLWANLHHALEQDLETSQQLCQTLEQERKALESRDYETFQPLIRKKSELLNQLEIHASERSTLLQRHGYQDEKSTLAAAKSQAPLVAKSWLKLAGQWARCQELNDINERMAQRTRLVVGQVLEMIRGKAGGTCTYTAKGATQQNGTGQSITSA